MTAVAIDDGVFRGPFPGQQWKFFERTEREVFYGGAGGGGKSLCGMGKFGQQLAVEQQRYKAGEITKSKAWGIYFRRTMPDLVQAINRSFQFFQDIDPDAHYNVNDHIWTIPSCGDAHFQFAHMETEKAKFKYKSSEFTYVFYDELTEFTETMYEYMDTRLRTTDPILEPMLQLCSASNPDGPGLLWVRKRFIEGKDPEVVYRKLMHLRDGRVRHYDTIFIPASLKDNPVLYRSGAYEASLLNKRPEVREAILEGNWWVNPGAFLGNIWDSSVHICKNHEVPRNVKVVRSCDPAPSAPTSVTWWYVDSDGGFTGIHNLYVRNHDAQMTANRIREIEIHYGWWDEDSNQSTLYGPMDEDAFNKNMAGGPSYAKVHAASGIRWKRSRKDRFNGASEIVRRLNVRHKSLHPGEPERPALRWMERCKAPIETLPVLQADPNDVNDVDSKGEDHCMAPYTIIRTKHGDKPIVSLVGTSGHVLDRNGKWTEFRNCRRTRRNTPTVSVIFSDGYRVQCTPDHRFRAVGGEWVEAKDLRGRSCMEAGNGGSRRDTTGTITASNCTGKSGPTLMGRFRQTTISTIVTATRRITSSTTWSALRRALTAPFTTRTLAYALGPLRALEVQGASRLSSMSNYGAFNAMRPSMLDVSIGRARGSARSNAAIAGHISTSGATAFVRSAAQVSALNPASLPPLRADTHAGGLYVVDVQPAPPTDVYCIEVPNGHEFALVNGVIVSNCWDETMYMCLDRVLPKRDEKIDDDDDIVDLDEYRNRGRRGGGFNSGGALGVPPSGW